MRTKDPKISQLRNLDVLSDLPTRSIRSMAPMVDEVVVEPGTVLIQQGQLNRHAYFVETGSLRIEVDDRVVAHVTAGSVVGERTAMEHLIANATVVAAERSRVFAISHGALRGAAADVPTFRQLLLDLSDSRTAA